MVQCPEAHLFCSTCISTYASTQLGIRNSSLTCIHPSSCSPHTYPRLGLCLVLIRGCIYILYRFRGLLVGPLQVGVRVLERVKGGG